MKDTEVARIAEWQKAIQFRGTPEMGYTDSGLWSFLPYVYTNDSHDEDTTIKPLMSDFPEYMVVVFLYMLACPTLAIPKSRQMRMSWAASGYGVWNTMRGPFRKTIYQTRKEDAAFDMVSQGSKNPAAGRMDFIIQHLPGWLRDGYVTSGRGNQVGKISFSPKEYDELGFRIPWHGSAIHAVPQGADQVRQYTINLMLSDESAFQEEFRAAMEAAGATITGGGQVICLSSVDKGSAFNQMVLAGGGGDKRKHEVNPIVQRGLDILGMEWPKGLRSWETPSGMWCLEVHYSADPAKDPERDGAAWLAEAVKKPGYDGDFESSAWKTEMEIDYTAGGGDPVFSFITGPAHPIFCDALNPETVIKTMELYAGYDYGVRTSSMQVWGFDKNGETWAVWELVEPCANIVEHTSRMKACPYWKHLNYIVCDPSITAMTQQTANGKQSIAEQFANYGVTFIKGRRGADVPMVTRFKSEYWADPEHPTAHITRACPSLMKTVRGLRWKRHLSASVAERTNEPETIMDKDNHDWDATAYLFDTRPSNWIAPTAQRTGICFQDLLDIAEQKHRERTSPDRSAIRVA